MITQTVTVEEKCAQNIIIGRRGTYNTEQIVFDLSYLIENYGEGTAILMNKRSQDSTTYPVSDTAQDGNTLTWTVSAIDSNYKGHGECELLWYVNNSLAKSIIWTVVVLRDILGTTEEAPEPYESWVDTLTELGAETLTNAQNAAQSEANAEESANNAETKAQEASEAAESIQNMTVDATTLASGSAATVEKTVNPESGVVNLSFGIPQGIQGQQGVKGDTGATPAFAIGTVSTLEPGASATASITGTSENPVLNLGIPKGLKGDTGEVSQAEFDSLSGTVTDLNRQISDFTETTAVEEQITDIGTLAGGYIDSDNNIYGTTSPDTFTIKYIPVSQGETYRITADQIKSLFAIYGLVAFSENVPARTVSCSTLIEGSTTVRSIDFTYTPDKNGYLSVAMVSGVPTNLNFFVIEDETFITTDKTLTIANMPADAKETGDRFDLLGYTTQSEKSDVINAEHTVLDRYIQATGRIATAGSNAFAVSWYPVSKGKVYNLSGSARVGGDGQALICFDNVFDSTANHVCKSVIQTATTTMTEYDITYTPTEDGFIVMPNISNNKIVVTLTSDTDFQRIYDLEQAVDEIESEIGKTKIPIKIQLFGDSITDNLWGDKTTWANYIQQNLSDYNVTVVNDAVGGSGIGHGASKGTTESHQDDEYNFVWDLVTNGTTLQTDADYIVILVGTNSWASGVDLGDMSSTGNSTVYGSLKDIIEYISQHSAATVFVCTIPQRYNTTDQGRNTNTNGEPLNDDGVSLADYCEAFRKVSAFYGMPCIHLNESLGWNRLNISYFCGDGLHPNTKGDKMLSAFICSEIQKHIGKVSYA